MGVGCSACCRTGDVSAVRSEPVRCFCLYGGPLRPRCALWCACFQMWTSAWRRATRWCARTARRASTALALTPARARRAGPARRARRVRRLALFFVVRTSELLALFMCIPLGVRSSACLTPYPLADPVRCACRHRRLRGRPLPEQRHVRGRRERLHVHVRHRLHRGHVRDR